MKLPYFMYNVWPFLDIRRKNVLHKIPLFWMSLYNFHHTLQFWKISSKMQGDMTIFFTTRIPSEKQYGK